MSNSSDEHTTLDASGQESSAMRGRRQSPAVQPDGGAADLTDPRKRRAVALCTEVEQRFTAAAAGAPRRLVSRTRSDHYGRLTATLTWRDPLPARELTIYVNPMEGMMEWSWIVGGVLKTARRTDALLFQPAQLDELLTLLSDQEAWSQRTLPV